MMLSKQPYRGYHLVLMRNNATFQVHILDGSNNAVQPGLSLHSTEEDALDEARKKVDSLVGQHQR